MGDCRNVSIQVMGYLAVGNSIVRASVGIYSDILIRTVRKEGM